MYYKLRYPIKKQGAKEPEGRTTISGRKKDIFVHTFQADSVKKAKEHARAHLRSAANDDILGRGKITLREGISAYKGHFQMTKKIPFEYK